MTEVCYEKNGRTIIDRVSLNLAERRIGLVGRNGSGKSTLARLLCGLIEPTSGAIRVDGIDVARDRRQAIKTVGIIFQNPDHQIIFPTVEEEIAFGLSQLGSPKESARAEAKALLANFDRLAWAERPIHSLSQGERHLVCLLSTIAMKPSLIILDEPFAGLDIPTTRQLERLLDGLEPALILISHDPRSLTAYDRVVWLEEGRIRLDGAAKPVLAQFVQAMERLGDRDDLAVIAD